MVKWSSDCAVLAFNESMASFTDAFSGKIKVTASAGDFSKVFELQVSATSGIDETGAGALEVVNSRYYNVSGIEVAAPAAGDGNAYVVVRTFSDGSVKVEKIVMK